MYYLIVVSYMLTFRIIGMKITTKLPDKTDFKLCNVLSIVSVYNLYNY